MEPLGSPHGESQAADADTSVWTVRIKGTINSGRCAGGIYENDAAVFFGNRPFALLSKYCTRSSSPVQALNALP